MYDNKLGGRIGVPLLYPSGNPRNKSTRPEDSREFSEGLLSGYIVSVLYAYT